MRLSSYRTQSPSCLVAAENSLYQLACGHGGARGKADVDMEVPSPCRHEQVVETK